MSCAREVFWTVAIRTSNTSHRGRRMYRDRLPRRVLHRAARRSRQARLLIGLIIPFFVSYLMRMLAWIGLLMPDGYVNKVLIWTGLESHERNWLAGQASTVIIALIYGYVPYLIIPLFAALDRIDERLLEAARDLGATRRQAFLRVTLPLSKQGILAGAVLVALPMFGDFYTNDLISGSPQTSMIGNQINLYYQGGVQPTIGAALVILLSIFLALLMCYYVFTVARASQGQRMSEVAASPSPRPASRPPPIVADHVAVEPMGSTRFLAVFGWMYMLWAIAPVVVAMQFAFNDGRSRSVWQGFSIRWCWGTRTSRSSMTRADQCAVAEPRARGARHADRGAARLPPRARSVALARWAG